MGLLQSIRKYLGGNDDEDKKNAFQRVIMPSVKTAVFSAMNPLGNAVNIAGRAMNKSSYFKPVANKVRVRDVVRELPTGIKETAQGIARPAVRFGISALQVPQTAYTGKANTNWYNTPVGRVNSIQGEFQNRRNMGQSFPMAFGHSVLDTAFGAGDVSSVAKPFIAGVKSVNSLLPRNAVTKEVGNIATDLLSPLRPQRVIPGIVDTLPERFAPGYRIEVPGIPLDTKPGRFLPAQSIRRTADRVVNMPFQPQSGLFRSLQRPGLTVKEVGGGQPTNLPLLKEGVFRTPNQAMRSFEKTGQVPRFTNVLRPKTKPLEMSMSQRDQAVTDIMNAPKVAGETPLALPRGVRQAPLNVLRQKDTIIPRPNVDAMPRTTLGDVEKILYGNEAGVAQQGTREGVGMVGNLLRKGETAVDAGVSRLLSSDNVVARSIGNTLRGFGGTFGKKESLQRAGQTYRGGIDYGQKLAQDIRKITPSDPKSLERIHSNLDPELYGGKTAQLTPEEQQATDTLRTISDYINDTNYKNGFVSEENWLKNRGGKYITRAYEEYDMPPEVADFVKTANAKFDLNPFKQRGEVNDWKMENSIKDPAYLVGKRLQQTEFNDSVKRMFDYLKQNPEYVSDVPKGGFDQLSDHKAYGDLAGKFVRKDVMEQVKGMYYTNDILQKGYDILNWYDRNPARRGLKQMMTVWNPAVRLGNNFGNYVFGWLGGVNPITFTKNQIWASKAIKRNDPLTLQLSKDGILGTGTHRGDIVAMAQEITKGVKDKNVLQKVKEVMDNSYGFVDDRGKVAAVKTFLDRGYSYEEATRRAMRAFQNYNTVGFLYDLGAKLPVFGNPFVRFSGSLASIMKNAVVDHPLRAVSTAMALKFLGDATSVMSGEAPEDKATREGRVGAPHIPFTDISLEMQTPWGAVNVARMLGVYASNPVGGQSVASDLAKMAPFNVDIKDPAKGLGSDPLIGPVISSLITDKDFRGKSIADPNQTKYTKSTLTPGEQWANRGKYLLHSYTPSVINSAVDVNDALKGQPNFYDKVKTPKQAISSMAGFKVEEYGKDQAYAQRMKDMQFDQYARDDSKKQINSILKQQATGSIDEATAQKRITNIQKKIPTLGDTLGGKTANAQGKSMKQGVMVNPSGGFSYIDGEGNMKTAKTQRQAEIALDKIDFEQSDASFKDLGDYVLRKNSEGKATSEKKTKYVNAVLKKQMSVLKTRKDTKNWMKAAQMRFQNLEEILKDQTLDQLEKLELQSELDALVSEASKVKAYGGFKKPKKAKAPKLDFSTPNLSPVKTNRFGTNVSSGLKLKDILKMSRAR